MKDTFTNIDELILGKTFSELTPSELDSLKEVATDATGFNQIKATLLAIKKEMLTAEEITPRESSKQAILAAFDKARPALNAARTTRSMGLGYFFPKDKSIIQMPGVQVLSVAASILLIIALFDFSSDKFQTSEQAYITNEDKHKATKKQTSTNKQEEVTSKNATLTYQDKNTIKKSIATDSTTPTTPTPPTTPTAPTAPVYETSKTTTTTTPHFSSTTNNELTTEATIYAPPPNIDKNDQKIGNRDFMEMEAQEEEVAEDFEIAANNSEFDQPITIQSNATSAKNTLSSSEASASKESVASSTAPVLFKNEAKKSKNTHPEITSRTLADDSKLIELFYTAM